MSKTYPTNRSREIISISESIDIFIIFDTEYKKQGYWYVDHTQDANSVFDFDTEKGFKTIESIEKYIKKQCVKEAKEILKYNQVKG